MDKKISQLSGATTPLTGTEELAIVQGGSTVKATAQDIADLAGGSSYLVYRALLSQTGTNDPTVIVLENTLSGPIVWTRSNTGIYVGTLAGAFTTNKTIIRIDNNFAFSGPNFVLSFVNMSTASVNSFEIRTVSTGAPSDGMLLNTPVEVLVYP